MCSELMTFADHTVLKFLLTFHWKGFFEKLLSYTVNNQRFNENIILPSKGSSKLALALEVKNIFKRCFVKHTRNY